MAVYDRLGSKAAPNFETLQHHVPGGQGSPNVLDGKVTGRCMQRHRHQEFIRFVNTVEAAVPAGNLIHEIADNYATCKHPKVRQLLARHQRRTFHFTSTCATWLGETHAMSPVELHHVSSN